VVLSSYLKRAGVVTGPLSRNTSHSALDTILTGLRGLPPKPAFSAHNNFGSATHEQYLEDKVELEVTVEEQELINEALEKLRKHPLAKQLYKDSVREDKKYKKLHDVLMSYILDIHKPKERIGADLKTTSCVTQQDFVSKAKDYKYFRQAATYSLLENLKLFFFIAVTKTRHKVKVFILCAHDHPEEMAYAEQELKFLLYFYKHYGKFTRDKKEDDI